MSDNSRKVPPSSPVAAGSGEGSEADELFPGESQNQTQDSTASQPLTQEDSPSSQNKSDRLWKLKKMGFRILGG
jgi:hypothetical protein